LMSGMEDIRDYVAEVFSNEIGTDEVLLHLLPANYSVESDHRIRSYLQAKLRVTPHIRYVNEQTLQALQFPGTARKPVKFIDRRSSVDG
jgi:phenylacetate-CoA ligase